MSQDRVTEIAAMHAEYERLTGLRVSLMGREWAWFEWLKRGLTISDLRLLVADKRRRIQNGDLPQQSMLFRNLVGNVDYAEEDIGMLRARHRGTAQDPSRAAVLRATGRDSAAPAPDARKASEVAQKLTSDPAAAAAALEQLQRLKRSL